MTTEHRYWSAEVRHGWLSLNCEDSRGYDYFHHINLAEVSQITEGPETVRLSLGGVDVDLAASRDGEGFRGERHNLLTTLLATWLIGAAATASDRPAG